MSNFEYLSSKSEYSLFSSAAIEAEKVFSTSPAMCAVGCRKALELAVKWVYAADKTITMPYKDNLQSLLHEPSFRFAVDRNVWSVLPSIVKAGNLAVHTGHSVSAADAVFSLRGLFDFIQWVDYCYGTDYVERSFDETAIPGEKVTLDEKKIREQESLLTQKDAELEALRKQVESLSAAYTASKQQNQQSRSFTAADLTEAETRRKIIDIDLKAMGWKFTGPDADVRTEYEVDNMNGVLGQKGYADYVLMGKDGLPLAVIEAKRSTKDPNIGRKQAQLYADCLEQKFGRRPMLFTTNGYTTYFWDEQSGPQRAVSGVFCKDDLQKLMNRRTEKKPLDTIEIDDKITDRYYQKNAIRAVCAHIAQGFRRNLLVMATGTGKTRTASSLTDVLSRGGHVTNVLFLADRTALVKQAKDDLQKLMNRRTEKKPLDTIEIDDKITDRYYQKNAIRAVCAHITQGFRRNLLVMATGTGKTRTASSLTDVLSRGGHVTNVLFLADRTALVKQAKDDFKKYLPDQSLCNLCSSKDDKAARIVFSTYPTMLNAIDNAKTKDGVPLFSPAHFDLIIVDESHRSIFKKYRAIFDYFDAILVGLTATPKTDVDRNTYDFFEMEHGIPTYAYDYDTAVYTDHVLVPYYNYEVKTKFTEEGIHYDQLSPEDKARYEDDFAEDDTLPTFIPSEKLNKFIFNANTVDTVLQDLMERGIQTAGGDRIGKTIIFAQNKRHAEFIRERFGKLYPQLETQYPGFIQRVVCDDAYAQSIIDDFKQPDKPPFIAVSVDMMDTGIDVPECVNLVFFKKVRSKTKFWQMIGRGTRLCPSLACVDAIDGEYTGKRRFLIFDYCGNFEFFRQKPNGYESADTKSLSESIFCKQVRIAAALQDGAYGDESYQNWRKILTETCRAEVGALNPELVSVRLHRQAVEHYQKPEAFVSLTETDKGTLMKEVAPLISPDDKDEAAKRFDNFVYGLLLCELEGLPGLGRAQKQLRSTAAMLEGKATIPQVQAKLPLIREVQTDEFLTSHDLLRFEEMRQELRELIKFLVEGGEGQKPVYTALADPVLKQTEGKALDSGYDFGEYRERVNRYIMEHRSDTLAIHKLTQNIPLSQGDYTELEHIFTCELGSKEDYAREFRDTPFGLLVRKVAKLDHDAAMQAFSKFINDESLNAKQIAFVQKVIHYIEQNGYVESKAVLMKPPFDQPILFTRLFDGKTGSELMETINSVKENATHVTA